MAINVAVVGCGAVAQKLYRGPLRQLDRQGLLRVKALVDPVAEHARFMGAELPQAKHFGELRQALALADIDLVLVLTPAHLHCSQAVEALEAGCNVFCEKPMASSVAECDRMNAAADRAGKVLAIGMIRRFFPAYAQLQQLLRNGELGPIRSFDYREGHKFEWDVTTPSGFKPRAQGGAGVMFDIGPHVVDALQWLLGELRVRAYFDDTLSGIEANARIDLQGSGWHGSVALSWDYPALNELRVVGEKAEAVLRVDRFDQLAVGRAGQYLPVPLTCSYAMDLSGRESRRMLPRTYPDAISCQLVQVLRAIELKVPAAVDGRSGSACIGVLESALAMARPLPAPWLEEAEQQAYQRLHWRAGA